MKREYWAAVAACMLIPVVVVGGMGFVVWVNPEWALRTAHYSRNFHLLEDVRYVLMAATAGASALLWLAVFLLVLTAKGRSWKWAALAVLGPFGLVGLAMLADVDAAPGDAHARWRAGQGFLRRAASEAVFFFAAWTAAYGVVVLKRNIQILLESWATGTPVAQIVAVQSASSGMWAFSEGMEQIFLIAMMYLAWPICFNLAARLKSAVRLGRGRP
ncbi:MAG: hypothetical protein ACHQ49_10490 [Elusimicrobiota bacterium]